MLAAIVAVAVAAAWAAAAAPRLSRPAVPARALPQRASSTARNAHDIFLKNDYLYDSSYETCGAIGLPGLASRLRVEPRPDVVATAFASRFDPSIRRGPRAGCLQALTEPTTLAGAPWGRRPTRK